MTFRLPRRQPARFPSRGNSAGDVVWLRSGPHRGFGRAEATPMAPETISMSGIGQLRSPDLRAAPLLRTYQLRAHLNASDTTAYLGGAAPADGTQVTYLRAASGLHTPLVERSDRNAPTFMANGDGAGRSGLRFESASTQALEWPGFTPVNSSDQAFTLWAVFRMIATPSGRQTLLHINRDGAVNAFREVIRLNVTATQFIVQSGNNSSATDDTNSAVVTATPAAGETYIMVGAKAASAPNRIRLRIGGATQSVTNANNITHNFSSTAALQQAFIGGYRRGGWSEHANMILFSAGWYPTDIGDTDIAALIDALRNDYGVA